MMIMPFQKENVPWNKELTRESDKRVRKLANSIKKGYRNGRVGWNKGKKLTEIHKQKISMSEKGKDVSKETREKISKTQTGRKLTSEWKKKISINTRKNRKPISKEGIKSIIEHNKKMWTQKHKKYMSKIMKNKFKDEEFIKKYIKSVNRKPNKKEIMLSNVLKKNNFQYKYVGNLSFWIGGKNPDFVNVNGQKKVIELFGDYWHNLPNRQTPEQRINHFKEYGFDCLVVWESEMEDIEKVLERIKEFDGYA